MILSRFAFITSILVMATGCASAPEDPAEFAQTESELSADPLPKWRTDLPAGAFSFWTTFPVTVHYASSASGRPTRFYTQQENIYLGLKSDGTDLFVSHPGTSPGTWQRFYPNEAGCFILYGNSYTSTEHSWVETNLETWGCLLENRKVSLGGYKYEREWSNRTGSGYTIGETKEIANPIRTWNER